MKKLMSLVVILFLGSITAQSAFLLLLHERMRWKRNLNVMFFRLNRMKTGEMFKDSTLYDTTNQELNKAIISYEQGVYQASLPIFEKNANKGNSTARYYLARSYYYGQGIEHNYGIAIKLLAKSKGVTLVDAKSHFLLSRCYRYGKGTTRNIEKADSLVVEAACRGLDDAIELLQIEKEMSRNDVLDWLISILNGKQKRIYPEGVIEKLDSIYERNIRLSLGLDN